MRIGILGTGIVGQTIGSKLVALGHEVKLGSRSATNDKAAAWVKSTGRGASQGTFAEAASVGEIVFNCTSGMGSLDALRQAGDKNLDGKVLIDVANPLDALGQAGAKSLDGKVLIDVANPLDFSKGMPPTLSVSNTDSLGEQIQRAFPKARVVKSLNTVTCAVMVEPAKVPGDHTLFVCGNDAAAKTQVTDILKKWFGWKTVIDLGDISAARGTEMLLILWVRLMGAFKSPNFNFIISRANS